MEQLLFVGVDFGNETSQVSYYNFKEKEPVSIDFSGLEAKYQIPTVISKSIGREQWFIGDEARQCSELGEAVLVENLMEKALLREPVVIDDVSLMPVDLFRVFFDNLLHAALLHSGMTEIGKVCITLEHFYIELLNLITEALTALGIAKENIILAGREESFIYYALSQSRELWQNDVALFNFDEKGLTYYRLYTMIDRGSRIVMTHKEDLRERVPYIMMGNNASAEELLDDRLLDCAKELFGHENISTVYLTGKGFEGELHIPNFLRFICDRRRVFAGQNLYTKGASYQAYDAARDTSGFRDMILACPQRITTGVEVKIQSRGKDKILRLVKPGQNWYGADVNLDFILDDTKEFEIFLSPLDAREKRVEKISLEDFPNRPNKATRVNLCVNFTSDSRCHIVLRDKGFGEFYQSSGRVIDQELIL